MENRPIFAESASVSAIHCDCSHQSNVVILRCHSSSLLHGSHTCRSIHGSVGVHHQVSRYPRGRLIALDLLVWLPSPRGSSMFYSTQGVARAEGSMGRCWGDGSTAFFAGLTPSFDVSASAKQHRPYAQSSLRGLVYGFAYSTQFDIVRQGCRRNCMGIWKTIA